MLLYEQWRETSERRVGHVALRERGRVWTFGDLQRALERLPIATGPVELRGRSSAFVIETLRAWRDGQVAVPMEEGVPFDQARAQLDRVPEDVVHVKTTSGSTGTPRHVLFTADQLAADAAQIISTMGLRSEWPNVGVISFAHSYGFSNLVLPLLLHGIPLILVPDPLPETMRGVLNNQDMDGIVIPAVPAMWRSWSSAGILGGERLKIAISAGAVLPLNVEQSIFESCGLKVHNFLGASECGGIAYDRTGSPRCAGSLWIGSALDGVALAMEESGLLRVSSAAVGKGYWPNGEPTLGGGQFQTADIVRLENVTDVHLLGRADDVINIAGRKVRPEEIEGLLSAQPDVLHAIVFGVESLNASRGGEIVAIVSLRQGADLAPVRRAVAHALVDANWKMPRHWRVDPQVLPDNRGKISRATWKRRFLAGKWSKSQE